MTSAYACFTFLIFIIAASAFTADIHIMEERGAPLLGKARGTSENLGRETRENGNERKKE